MTAHVQNANVIPEAQRGPAEKLLTVITEGDQHIYHGRPGLNVGGKWVVAPRRKGPRPAVPPPPPPNAQAPGLFVPAAVEIYRRLLEVYDLHAELAARFASYALLETDWRDLQVALAALMLVQKRKGELVRNQAGDVEFLDDNYRDVGQGMILRYAKRKAKASKGAPPPDDHGKGMLSPKAILRIARFLELPEICALNRAAGFADPAGRGKILGRWPKAAHAWLFVRESNPAMLKGLVDAGYKNTVRTIAEISRYVPISQTFYEVLRWKQKQATGGHRTIGLSGLNIAKAQTFEGLSEEQICEHIVAEKLSYKAAMGRLPKGTTLTPAIMVAVLPTLSDADLRILTPSLEELGLLKVEPIRLRWEQAIASATDQRALNIAKNVQSKELREKLEGASDEATKKAVAKAVADADVHVMFLVDVSGSMEGAIEKSKDALAKILAGFPAEKLHIASFNTMGTVLKPKAPTRAGVQAMLANVKSGGGTQHGVAVRALHASGVRVPDGAHLVVIVAGDEDGESGADFAQSFRTAGYQVAAFGHIVAVATGPVAAIGAFGQRMMVATGRGQTVRECARVLGVPYCEVDVERFEDPYAVPRVLRAMLEAPLLSTPSTTRAALTRASLVEKIMKCPLLAADGRTVA